MAQPPITRRRLQDPVSRYLRREASPLHVRQTVGEALERLRHDPPEGRIIYFYVVDDDNRLRGVVPTRRLVLSPPDRPLAEIMVGQVVAIPSRATVLDACEFFTLHRFLAFPVVDDDGRFLGVIDAELYTEELSELEAGRFSDDLFQLIGVHVREARQASPLLAFRYRFPWLHDQIETYARQRQGRVIELPDGTAARCSFCDRPAVTEGWGWYRLVGLIPLLPRYLFCCDRHGPAGPGPDDSSPITSPPESPDDRYRPG